MLASGSCAAAAPTDGGDGSSSQEALPRGDSSEAAGCTEEGPELKRPRMDGSQATDAGMQPEPVAVAVI